MLLLWRLGNFYASAVILIYLSVCHLNLLYLEFSALCLQCILKIKRPQVPVTGYMLLAVSSRLYLELFHFIWVLFSVYLFGVIGSVCICLVWTHWALHMKTKAKPAVCRRQRGERRRWKEARVTYWERRGVGVGGEETDWGEDKWIRLDLICTTSAKESYLLSCCKLNMNLS